MTRDRAVFDSEVMSTGLKSRVRKRVERKNEPEMHSPDDFSFNIVEHVEDLPEKIWFILIQGSFKMDTTLFNL